MNADLSHAQGLLRTAYPGRKIIAHLVAAQSNVPFRTFEIDGSNGADLEGADVFSVVEFGDDSSPQPPVELVVTLPHPSIEDAPGDMDQGPPSVGASIRTAVALSPLLFEQMKYAKDRRAEAKLPDSQFQDLPDMHPEEGLSADTERLFREEGARKRPAILIGFHWLEHGGAEKLAFDTVAWALAAGLRVIVVAAHNVEHRLAHRLPDSSDVSFVRMDRYIPHIRTREFLRNLVLRENVRTVHIHHCPPLFDALPAIRSVAPDVHVISSTHIVEYKRGGYVYTSGQYGKYIDTQHVISRQLGHVLHGQLGSEDGIVLGRILEGKPDPAERLSFSDSLADRPLRILFVGRMSYQKRPVLAAMIMRSLATWSKSKKIQLDFDVVGEGPYLPVFKRLMERYDLNTVCRLHGASTDVPQLMKRADILILPSANEGLALVCYEAVQAGTIPISTDVGAQSELIPAELLVDRNPRKALRSVRAIVDRLVTDPGFYRNAVDALLSRFDEVNSETTAHEALSAIYESVATPGDENGQ